MPIILTSAFIWIACIGSFLLAGCESASQTNAKVLVRTSRTAYHIDDTVQVEVTNLSGSSIYYLCEGQIQLQLMDGENVRKSWSVHGFDLCGSKRPILLGEAKLFLIKPDRLDSVALDPVFESGGEYRLLVDLYEDPECTVLLEDEGDRLSNRISVTR